MKNGYIYILINQSMPGLIKIGITARDARSRARELSNTSVPTPFEVAFELFSENFEVLEKTVHEALDDFRVSGNREFFRYPLDKAISLIQKLNTMPEQDGQVYVAINIFNRLVDKYPDHLQEDIVSVRIVQQQERVWLEITTEEEIAGYLKDQTIHRMDLGFITDEVDEDDVDLPFFNSDDPIELNADKFVEDFSSYSIAMVTDLFKKDMADAIVARHVKTNQQDNNAI